MSIDILAAGLLLIHSAPEAAQPNAKHAAVSATSAAMEPTEQEIQQGAAEWFAEQFRDSLYGGRHPQIIYWQWIAEHPHGARSFDIGIRMDNGHCMVSGGIWKPEENTYDRRRGTYFNCTMPTYRR